jgi:hypothetical protein
MARDTPSATPNTLGKRLRRRGRGSLYERDGDTQVCWGATPGGPAWLHPKLQAAKLKGQRRRHGLRGRWRSGPRFSITESGAAHCVGHAGTCRKMNELVIKMAI